MESPNHNPDGPTTMKASEFKARCLRLMDEVAASGHEIIITKNGRQVSRLVPTVRSRGCLSVETATRFGYLVT